MSPRLSSMEIKNQDLKVPADLKIQLANSNF